MKTDDPELTLIPCVFIEELSAEEVGKSLPPTKPVPGSHALPEIQTGVDFMAVHYPKRKEPIPQLLSLGTKLVLAGASKAGKTWLLLAMALAVANGLPWLGLPTRKSKVIYVNLEILDDYFQDRVRMTAKAMGAKVTDSLLVWNLRGYATDIKVLADLIICKIQQIGGCELVLIDPIYKCYGWRDENSASDMADFLSQLELITARTGAAVVIATHYSKGNQAGKSSMDRTSGSGVFARDADTYVSVTEHSKENHFTVEFVVRNGPEVAPFVLERKFPLFVRAELDPKALKGSRGATMKSPAAKPNAGTSGRPQAVSDEELLTLLAEDGLAFGKWRDAAKAALGCSETVFKERRRKLQESGRVKFADNRYHVAVGNENVAV